MKHTEEIKKAPSGAFFIAIGTTLGTTGTTPGTTL